MVTPLSADRTCAACVAPSMMPRQTGRPGAQSALMAIVLPSAKAIVISSMPPATVASKRSAPTDATRSASKVTGFQPSIWPETPRLRRFMT